MSQRECPPYIEVTSPYLGVKDSKIEMDSQSNTNCSRDTLVAGVCVTDSAASAIASRARDSLLGTLEQ